MAGEKRYTRIPPESTGDRVYMIHTAEIEFKNGGQSPSATYGNHTWQIGDRYDVAGFGKVHIHGVYDRNDGTGILAVHYSQTDKFENNEPATDALISFEGTNVGQVSVAYDVYVPANNIMGYDNPEFGLNVDPQGSAQITFAEGEPQLDAWGKLRTSGATKLGDYVFADESVLTENFSRVSTRGPNGNSWETTAFVTYNDTGRYVDVGVNNPTDLSTATAHTYHHYIAGSSHLFMGTCLYVGAGTVNSPVATGVSRRFGLFDANNGFMFHVGPDGVLYLEQRNSNSGTKVDKLLACSDPTTAQTLGIDTFNGDLLNGQKGALNTSGILLDLSKNNQYWIDAQWHGAGRVRFGLFHNGRRVVIHEYYHNNRYDLPMSQTISLPVCTATYAYTQAEIDANPYWSQLSLSGASNSVEIKTRIFSQAMWTETDINLQAIGRPKTFSTGHLPVTDTAFQYVFSLRVKPLSANSTTNHSLIVPTRVAVISYDNDVATTGQVRDAIVHWRMSVNTVHHGHEWSDVPGTNMQVSYAGENYETADVEHRILEDMYNGRGEKVLTDTFIDFQNGAWKNRADDGGTHIEHLTSVTGSSTGTVTVSGAINAGETVITVTDTTGLAPGTLVSHPNFESPEHVMRVIDGTSFMIHQPTTGAFTGGESISFTVPVTVEKSTTNENHWILKEPYDKTFGPNPDYLKALNFDGLTLSSDDVYLYFIGSTTAVLYADKNWATPITSTGTYTGSDAQIYGFVGPEYVVTFYAHEQVGYQDPRAMFVVEWKEIIQ